MPVRVIKSEFDQGRDEKLLQIHAPLLEEFLVRFLQSECIQQRGMKKAVIGLSGGVDSAVSAYLASKAFGAENVLAVRMPYELSSQASLDHAQLCIDALGIESRTVDISEMVNGYAKNFEPDLSPTRLGNICARCRMIILYDLSAKIGGLPIGTGNKTERLFGYYTWHADDAPPINPLGDLYKTQVWQLARQLGVPDEIVNKPPTADLVKGQTDEGDFGISYEKADSILVLMLREWSDLQIERYGFSQEEIALVRKKVDGTHWKRKLPTTAMISDTAINEYYLRPVDYRGEI